MFSTKKSKFAAISLVTTLTIWLAVAYRYPQFRPSSIDIPFLHDEPPPPPPPEAPTLELFGMPRFADSVDIATLNIHAKPSDAKLPIKQKIPMALPAFQTVRPGELGINSSDPTSSDKILEEISRGIAQTTLTVAVGRVSPTPDASHIVFGVATYLERLPDALRGFKNWATNTQARFVISVEPHNPKNPDEMTTSEAVELFKQHGMQLTIIESTKGVLERYVSLLEVLHDHVDSNTRWVSIIDDDTFFFDMNSLLTMLNKYPTDESYYVGATSENKQYVDDGGIWAIGGAGIFMTVPLLQQLSPHFDECTRGPIKFGDAHIANCVLTYSYTKLSIEHGLYQLDLHGDVTGFYEAVRPQPVGVHHWKSWHHHDIANTALVGNVCGKKCILQTYEFQDGWQMTNGFSIVKYSYKSKELAKQIEGAMEHTWANTIWVIPDSWRYSLEPLKPKDEGKVQFLMEKVEEDKEAGTMTLYYVRRRDGFGNGVIRVTWSKVSD
jgi:hypothetical protein